MPDDTKLFGRLAAYGGLGDLQRNWRNCIRATIYGMEAIDLEEENLYTWTRIFDFEHTNCLNIVADCKDILSFISARGARRRLRIDVWLFHFAFRNHVFLCYTVFIAIYACSENSRKGCGHANARWLTVASGTLERDYERQVKYFQRKQSESLDQILIKVPLCLRRH